MDSKFENNSQIFKDDIRSLKEYMDYSFSTKVDLAMMEAKLTMRMFLFSVGQVLTIIVALIAIIHFMVK